MDLEKNTDTPVSRDQMVIALGGSPAMVVVEAVAVLAFLYLFLCASLVYHPLRLAFAAGRALYQWATAGRLDRRLSHWTDYVSEDNAMGVLALLGLVLLALAVSLLEGLL